MNSKTAKVLIEEYIIARVICVIYSDNLAMYAQYMCAKVAMTERCSHMVSTAVYKYNDKYNDKLTIAQVNVTSLTSEPIEVEIIIDTHCVTDDEVPINTEIIDLIIESLEGQDDPFENDEGLVVNIILI